MGDAAKVATGLAPDMEMALIAIGAALTFAMISEAISWTLIYRHEEYKNSVAEIVEI